MGKFMSKLFGGKEMRVLMLGLDASGKTTILYKLKLHNHAITTIPTVGFNVETISFKKFKMSVWVCSDLRVPLVVKFLLIQDVGGQDKIRPLWRHYYTGSQALIFVIDSADVNRLDEARQEFHRIVNDREMKDAIILLFANKQDLPNAIKPYELQDRLALSRLQNRVWYVQPCCAATGDGLFEGLTWLTSNYKQQ